MSIINPELNLPDDTGGASACEGTSKGMVAVVDKCRQHDHYIDLHSLGTFALTVDTNSDVSVGGNSSVSIAGNSSVSVGGDVTVTIEDNYDVVVNGLLRITPNGAMFIEGDDVFIDNLHIKIDGEYVSLSWLLNSFNTRISALE